MDALTILLKAKDEASKVFDRVRGSLSKINDTALNVGKQGFSTMGDAFKKSAMAMLFGSALLGGGLIGLGKNAITLSNDMVQTRIGFNTMIGSSDLAKKTLEDLARFAKKTPFKLKDLRQNATSLLGMGFAAEELLPTLDMLGNISAGVGTHRLPFLTLALSQVRTAGKLTGNELRQFSENGVPLLEMLAKESAKSMEEMRDAVTNGSVPFEDVQKVLKKATSQGGKFFGLMENQSKTFGGVMSNIGDTWDIVQAKLLGVSVAGDVKKGGLFDILTKAAMKFLNFIEKIDVDGIIMKISFIFNTVKTTVQPAIDLFNKFNQEGELLNSIMAGLAGVGLTLLIGTLATLTTGVLLATWPFILLGGIIAGFAYAYQKDFYGIQETTQKVFGYIKDVLLPLLIEKFNQLKDWFINIGMPAIQDFLNNTWKQLQEAFEFFTINVLPSLILIFEDLKRITMEEVAPALGELWESLQELWNLISPYIIPILGILAGILGGLLIGAIYILINVFKILVNVVKFVVDTIINIFKFLQTFFKSAINVISGVLKGDWGRVMDGFKSLGQGAVNFVSSAFGNLKKVIGDVVGGIGTAVSKAKDLGNAIKDKIPGFAVGTSHFSGGMAMVGERGPELVNLPAGSKVTRNEALRNSGSQPAQTVNFSPVINFNGFTKPSMSEAKEIIDMLGAELEAKIQKLKNKPQTI